VILGALAIAQRSPLLASFIFALDITNRNYWQLWQPFASKKSMLAPFIIVALRQQNEVRIRIRQM
ncbi:MAG: hypothetical protein IPM76_03155, partial [Chloroflexi bacterium]|nr:hypothetical protein [Chloroflexota bacterium]